MTLPPVTRFAPSPTGFLHLGHVVSALHARASAGKDGRFLVRIEDIDTARCTSAFTNALGEDLQWLGLWPQEPVRQQSRHLADYAHVLTELRNRELLYPCFCTRADIAAASTSYAPDGSIVYPGTCLRGDLSISGRVPAWRLNMQRALDELQEVPSWYEVGQGRISGRADEFGDVVLARRDTGVSYHLCVTHDDAQQGVNCVTRGRDLYDATSIHRVLQCLMKWPEPHYRHHALIKDEGGQKLSKRNGVEGIRTLRAAGWTAEQVLAHPLVLRALAES
ncbi:tRNA glutamyl-Q(34) synthetase GluQRS [Gluconobacter cerinus]|uniref:tRNA glutamyl-Q(34) synthetase GluQRS n=1 Tax=Gluconobacter cerinus TaxID=38307 RepID=UPI001B8CE3E3|nr:tRNA glutamyl-Q(34) synthetase GluQRS [Gluconobacter cerinus]MBS1034466.1 tRNA glutamyl-Q(34) synthetase GluQRS [Gluconobacter cerinus]